MSKKLKRGYTTGVHTSFAFKSALQTFLATKTQATSKTNKMDNDDLDVTKGCEIIVSISRDKDDLELNSIEHKPYLLKNDTSTLEVYAGIGVGVVTKDGLKPPKNHPAINHTPLKVMQDIFQSLEINEKKLFCNVSVTDGEILAKETANAKVGVLGGISILGTTGFVKPISATAYIDSIEQELNYAKANGYKKIIFTLGNTSYKKALEMQKDGYIIEIGNFIYDGIILAVKLEFEDIKLIVGVGKLVKIAQGFKNTHNRFGSIDFVVVQSWCDEDIKESLTIKGVREILGDRCGKFDILVKNKAQEKLLEWFSKNIEVIIC